MSAVPLNIDSVMQKLNEPANATSYEYDDLRKCIDTVESALRGTNIEAALDEAVRLCFSCLWIAFVMAKHAHPDFPTMADWGVLARMKTPFTKTCISEDVHREPGAPMWHASCFHDGQLVLGTGTDSKQLYEKGRGGQWSRVDMQVSTDIQEMMIKNVQDAQTQFAGTTPSQAIDNSIWNLVARP